MGHLLMMIENISRNRNGRGEIKNLVSLPENFKHRMKPQLSHVNKVCFNTMVKKRYAEKKNQGNHILKRAKIIFKHICRLTENATDNRFCRRK